jgi:hypothetical protein
MIVYGGRNYKFIHQIRPKEILIHFHVIHPIYFPKVHLFKSRTQLRKKEAENF